jgi:hypothetical protein
MLMLHNKCSKKVFFVLQTSSRGLYKLQTTKNEVNTQLTFFSQIKWGSTFPITQKLQIRNLRYCYALLVKLKCLNHNRSGVAQSSEVVGWSRLRRNSLYFHLIWSVMKKLRLMNPKIIFLIYYSRDFNILYSNRCPKVCMELCANYTSKVNFLKDKSSKMIDEKKF